MADFPYPKHCQKINKKWGVHTNKNRHKETKTPSSWDRGDESTLPRQFQCHTAKVNRIHNEKVWIGFEYERLGGYRSDGKGYNSRGKWQLCITQYASHPFESQLNFKHSKSLGVIWHWLNSGSLSCIIRLFNIIFQKLLLFSFEYW